MLLAVDIGNTGASFGLFHEGKLKKKWRVETHKLKKHKRLKKYVDYPAIVSSVVPNANSNIKKMLPRAKFINYKTIEKAGLKILLKNKQEIGIDRIVNALYAFRLFGGPTVIIDFGTATTFDVVSKNGEYLGGVIAPGIDLARDSLYEKTAKLPKIKISAPKKVIGDSTVSAMQSGLVFGYAALVQGIVKRIKESLRGNEEIKLIATGGYAKLISKFTKVFSKIDQDLTLKGLEYIYSYNEAC